MKYLRPEDKKIMNRNSLLEVSKKLLKKIKILKLHRELNLTFLENSIREK